MSTRHGARRTRRGIQSIEVGARLIDALVERGGPLMLRDLAAAAGMAPAKAHRYLVSFVRIGLVEQLPETGRYDLGAFALRLGLASLARLDAIRAATPVLAHLRDRVEETTALAVWGSYGATVVRWEEARRPVTVNLRSGGVLPLLTSATGRVFAAFLPQAQTRVLIDRELAAAARNPNATGPRTRRQVQALLREVRRRRMARVEGDLIPGVAALSAPVFDHAGRLVLALTALGHAGHFDTRWSGGVARALREAASGLSRRLGAISAPAE
ncbi:MAG TPA: IclR family transcriptional regulator [Burkholderiales bacterium]|jgi:DNA-binding IclR family transcriptional regulator|nr:IclR family transcriptional regulator [Burkholderiales bacterium]